MFKLIFIFFMIPHAQASNQNKAKTESKYSLKKKFNKQDVEINVFVENKSDWSKEEVNQHLIKSMNYFNKKCGLSIGPVNIEFGSRKNLVDFSSWRVDYVYASFNPNPKGIYIIFTGREREFDGTAYSWNEKKFHLPVNINSIFIFHKALYFKRDFKDLYSEQGIDQNFDILSHELGHVLLNEPENNIPLNFMSSAYDGMNINDKQCEKINKKWRN